MTSHERAGQWNVLAIITAMIAPALAVCVASLRSGAAAAAGLSGVTATVGVILGWFLYRGYDSVRYYLAFALMLSIVKYLLRGLYPPYSARGLVWLAMAIWSGWAAWALLESAEIRAFLERQRRSRDPGLPLRNKDGV